ncbi:chorismate--pyruvate lyase family protein [Natronorubrum sp. DTA7]|uniref:chorismate--pyruvate lyase family protein n=1 Tax=Natronorubrum sp. DTA7 TaxID=3447016 RepID=UPI003F8372CC
MTASIERGSAFADYHLCATSYDNAIDGRMKARITKRVAAVPDTETVTPMSDELRVPQPTDESIRSMLVTLERDADLTLSPIERLFLATDGTVTHMLEALTRGDVSVTILDRSVADSRLFRTVALVPDTEQNPLVWARSTIRLSSLADSVADELVDGEIGIGDVLREECTETRREIVEMNVHSAANRFPSFVESDAVCLLERTYQIYTADTRIMTITEYFPKDRLSTYRTQ